MLYLSARFGFYYFIENTIILQLFYSVKLYYDNQIPQSVIVSQNFFKDNYIHFIAWK